MKIGILGAGQLARMLAEAGIPVGHEFVFLDPAESPSAARLGKHWCASWHDGAALKALTQCDRITCDFENVPAEVLSMLTESALVRPSALAFEVAQDRLTEKQRFETLGLKTPGYRAIHSRPELIAAAETLGLPAVLKTRRLGYDGKGQFVIHQLEDLEPAWQQLSGHDLILEQWIHFDYECAITAVRSVSREVRCYPLSKTCHQGGILRFATAGSIDSELQQLAEQAIQRLMSDLDYLGCMTLELFVVNGSVVANEFAPRVHNSAHWTIEAAVCSQFENHLRAICDWPLGDTAGRGHALMVNFIGQLPNPGDWLNIPGLSWHDYNKSARPGRKVGHATLIANDEGQLSDRTELLQPLLNHPDRQMLSQLF